MQELWYHTAAVHQLLNGYNICSLFFFYSEKKSVCLCLFAQSETHILHNTYVIFIFQPVDIHACICSSLHTPSLLEQRKIPVWQYKMKISADAKGPLMSSLTWREQSVGKQRDREEGRGREGGRGGGYSTGRFSESTCLSSGSHDGWRGTEEGRYFGAVGVGLNLKWRTFCPEKYFN